MSTLLNTLSKKIPDWRNEAKQLLEEKGDKIVSNVTVAQAYGGMRGVIASAAETSGV